LTGAVFVVKDTPVSILSACGYFSIFVLFRQGFKKRIIKGVIK
jgi:hypothetical protein